MKTTKPILLLPRSQKLLARRYRDFLNSFGTYIKRYQRKLKTAKRGSNTSSPGASY